MELHAVTTFKPSFGLGSLRSQSLRDHKEGAFCFRYKKVDFVTMGRPKANSSVPKARKSHRLVKIRNENAPAASDSRGKLRSQVSLDSLSLPTVDDQENSLSVLSKCRIHGRYLIDSYFGEVRLLKPKKGSKHIPDDDLVYADPEWFSITEESGKGAGLKTLHAIEADSIIGIYYGRVSQVKSMNRSNQYEFQLTELVKDPCYIDASTHGSYVTYINSVTVNANCALQEMCIKGKIRIVVRALYEIDEGNFLSLCYSGNSLITSEVDKLEKKHTIYRFEAPDEKNPRKYTCQMSGREAQIMHGMKRHHVLRNFACYQCSLLSEKPFTLCSEDCYHQHLLDCSGKGENCLGNKRVKLPAGAGAARKNSWDIPNLPLGLEYKKAYYPKSLKK
jgi:hypothetical protein